MTHKFNQDFFRIVAQIVLEDKQPEEWAEIESGDAFQEGNYAGGFDATEMAFCFSAYLEGKEYWFQLSLEDIYKIRDGQLQQAEIMLADK
jgi:hypothetical protein